MSSTAERENTEEVTKPLRPLKVRRRTSAGPSLDAVSTYWPSGEKPAELTQSSWPTKVSRHSPEAAYHTFAVLSSEAVSTCWPSGEKTADLTMPV